MLDGHEWEHRTQHRPHLVGVDVAALVQVEQTEGLAQQRRLGLVVNLALVCVDELGREPGLAVLEAHKRAPHLQHAPGQRKQDAAEADGKGHGVARRERTRNVADDARRVHEHWEQHAEDAVEEQRESVVAAADQVMDQGALRKGAQHGCELAKHELVEPKQLSVASDLVVEIFLAAHRDDQHCGDLNGEPSADERRRERVETQGTQRGLHNHHEDEDLLEEEGVEVSAHADPDAARADEVSVCARYELFRQGLAEAHGRQPRLIERQEVLKPVARLVTKRLHNTVAAKQRHTRDGNIQLEVVLVERKVFVCLPQAELKVKGLVVHDRILLVTCGVIRFHNAMRPVNTG
eukprot:scaffold7109_cov63-Phaeocystis_antarctica.AAC.4